MKKRRFPLSQRLQYRFDNFMSKGSFSLIMALGWTSAMVILSAATLIYFSGSAPDIDGTKPGFIELVWLGLMHLIDQGTITGSAGSRVYLGIMLAVTAGGLLFLSVLIGILTTAIADKLEELRQGRSIVIEQNHIIILGWSQQVLPTICELVDGQIGQKPMRIVILGDKKKTDMEQQIEQRFTAWSLDKAGDPALRKRQLRNAKIICRRGNPSDLNDLNITGLTNARIIILHAPDTRNPDIEVVKTLMAIKMYLKNNNNKSFGLSDSDEKSRTGRMKTGPIIITELQEHKNHHLVSSLKQKFRQDRMKGWIIHRSDVISKIITQTCRQIGLADVIQEIISFDGNEIYLHNPEPGLIGQTFRDTLLAYEDAVLIGLYDVKEQKHTLNPDPKTIITEYTDLILMCESDPKHKNLKQGKSIPISSNQALSVEFDKKTEHTLVLGWNSMAQTILCQLDEYVLQGSTALVAVDETIVDRFSIQATLDKIGDKMKNLEIGLQSVDTTDMYKLAQLKPNSYNRVMALAYSDHLDRQNADAITLVTLMHLRDLEQKGNEQESDIAAVNPNYAIIAEMLDNRNRELAENTGGSDFVVSDRLLSLMVAQYAGDSRRADIFQELFSYVGNEIYLKPLGRYFPDKITEMTFSEITMAAYASSEIALGYVNFDERDRGLSGVHLNPGKTKRLKKNANLFDRIIVIAKTV